MGPQIWQPVHIDDAVEEKENARLSYQFLRWLGQYVPIDVGPLRGRKSLEMQLTERDRFPNELWGVCGPHEEVVDILSIVERELCWPSHNFVPEDPLVLVMTIGLDYFDSLYVFLEIEERYGVKYSQEETERMVNEAWTLGRFVQDVLERTGKS